jgi:hypothetical protein
MRLSSVIGLPFERRKYDLGRVARGISAPGPHRSVLDSLPSHGSCHPVHQEQGIHAQWANSRGYWAVTRSQQVRAFFLDASRLYFLRSQRIR